MRGRAARVLALGGASRRAFAPACPRRGRESGASPQRGEGGRGAAAPLPGGVEHFIRDAGLAVGLMVFEHIIRSRPRRRASHSVAEG